MILNSFESKASGSAGLISIGKNTPWQWTSGFTEHTGCFLQTQHQSKENILHGHSVHREWVDHVRLLCLRLSLYMLMLNFGNFQILQREWRMVWFWSRDESPAGKSRFRKVSPEDEHRLILQKFSGAIFQARIASLGLQLLHSSSWWGGWWDADIGWHPGLQWLWIYHSLALMKTTQEFHLVAVKREWTWHFLLPKCLSCFKAGNVKPLWQPAGCDFTWNNA